MPKRSPSLKFAYLFGFATILFVVASVTVLSKPLFAPDRNAATVAQADVASLPDDLSSILSLDEVQQLAKADGNGEPIQQIGLEQGGDTLHYVVTFRDGSSLAYDARSAKSIAHENLPTRTAEEREALPDNFRTGITIAQARSTALQELPKGTVKRIELEVHGGKVVYQVKFANGKYVSIDARSGRPVTGSSQQVRDETSAPQGDARSEPSATGQVHGATYRRGEVAPEKSDRLHELLDDGARDVQQVWRR